MAKLIYAKNRIGDSRETSRWYKVVVGFAATDGADVVTGGTQAVYELFSIPEGFFVNDLLVFNKTAWTSSVTLIFGDGGNDDGYLTSAHADPQTDDDTAGIPASSKANNGAYNMGRFYGSADTVDVTVGGANPDAGLSQVYIEVVDWNDFGRGV